MSAVDRLAFVTAISDSPTVVRLNLDDGVVWGAQAESEFGMPPLRRNVVGTLMRPGEQITADADGNREIKLVLNLLKGGDTAATELQKLLRELDRPTNLLRYAHPDSEAPVYFRTFRARPDIVAFDELLKQVTVTIPAEPYALGPMETAASAQTVNNDPAAGSNGMFLNLTGIKGDVETPLFIEYTGGGTGVFFPGLMVGVRQGSSPYPSVARQAESLTMGTDTTSTVDTNFSNGNKARCTFATVTAMDLRLSGTFPTGTVPAGIENRGTYRVFANVKQTDSAAVMKIKMSPNGSVWFEPEVTTNGLGPFMVDLGRISVHDMKPLAAGYGSTAMTAESLPELQLWAQRVSGTGSLDIDYILLVPADTHFGMWSAVDAGSGSGTVVVDGPNDMIYSAVTPTGASPSTYDHPPTSASGGYPHVAPGNSRLVIAVNEEAPAYAGQLKDIALTMTCRYWPRYLHVRPLAT